MRSYFGNIRVITHCAGLCNFMLVTLIFRLDFKTKKRSKQAIHNTSSFNYLLNQINGLYLSIIE